MPSNRKEIHGADLERVNAELRSSLEQCRALLAECRSKLAANEGGEPSSGQAEQRQKRS